jgi:hypothetical protein
VKHVSHEKSGVQKEVKNGPKKQTQKRTLNGPNSTENIQSKFPQKSGSNHCKRLIYLAFGAVPLNYFLLQFYTRPQMSRMRAQRAPVPP